MDALWASVAVGVALLVAAATLPRLLVRRAGPHSRRPDPATVERNRDAGSTPPAPGLPAPSARPPPSPVVDACLLSAERRRAYVDAFGKLPRPPRLLQHLLSPRLFQSADSRELVELIRAEPLIAARVLSAVDSAACALPCRITSLEQAVNWLGLDAVRILGLRYAMRAAFPADSSERRCRLDELWEASGLAAELAQRLASALDSRSRGLLVSAVLLSFLGRIAVAAAAPRTLLAPLSVQDPLQRLHAEQQALGLSAGQIGRLLMIEWKLAAALVERAAAIETLPLQPAAAFEPDEGALLALGHLCVRLGERIAHGELRSFAGFDLQAQEQPDWPCWPFDRTPLQHPALAIVAQRLRSGEFEELLERHFASRTGAHAPAHAVG